MRTKAAILLGFIAIGVTLIAGGIVLRASAAELCRGGFELWLFGAVVAAIALPFANSVRQGYQEALANSGAPTSKPTPVAPPPTRSPTERKLAIAEMVIAVPLLFLVIPAMEARRGSFGQSCFFLATLVFIVLAVMRFAFSVRSGHDEALREQWGKTGRCLTCGYDLRFNTSDICPECGKPVPSI